METEWEAKFININKEDVRARLESAGASLVKKETLYKRAAYFLPEGHNRADTWVRVRDEGDRITLSLKQTTNGAVETQKEVQLTVDNYDSARALLTAIGCREKAYQENYREVWEMEGSEVVIDEWPYVNPYIEIEGKSEEVVRQTAQLLGFDYAQALFGAVDQVISKQYDIPEHAINNEISRIVFDEPNPYLAWKEKQSH